MKPLFVLFIAGCTLMVVATGAIRVWRAGSSLLLGSGRIDGAAPPRSLYRTGFAACAGTRRLSCTSSTALNPQGERHHRREHQHTRQVDRVHVGAVLVDGADQRDAGGKDDRRREGDRVTGDHHARIAHPYRRPARPAVRKVRGMARDYLIMEKMIEGTNGSPGGWIASMHSPASGLLADIMTSKASPAASGTISLRYDDVLGHAAGILTQLYIGGNCSPGVCISLKNP